jgi:hypothetical protein
MMGRILFCLSAAACSAIGLCGDAMAASKNVGVVVTHNAGSVLTTYTIQETSGKNQPAGTVYIAGQAFRRGDLPPGTYPVFRDANTHAPLVQQLDEIATRRENGDDGSIRHLVFSVQLPAIPANGTYKMEIVKQTGTYSTTGKQTLSALAAAHDLKLHLTDVRNQDGSARGSGSLTFDINAAASNTRRDAPRKCASGPVRDCWIVVGPPIDDTTHKPDPLLYVTCYLDLTTSPSDQTSLGPVRHVCRVDNSWMNVAAGSTGNTGNPGPAGFANDPQAVSYRPQLLDGSANLLDWSWLDQSLPPSALNTANSTWSVPGSTGANAWYYGMPVLYTNSGGNPPAGMTNNTIYFVNYQDSPPDTTKVTLNYGPSPFNTVSPSDQGSGTHKFSFRVWHTHWQSWYTLDQTGQENWTSGSSRATSSLLPQFTSQEQLYWKETGTVVPLRMTTAASAIGDPTDYGNWCQHVYEPLSRNNVIGGSNPGSRPDLGIVNEYMAQAWLLQDATHWLRARIFALSGTQYQEGSMLNEATGRIPVLNNGPPAANHGGGGGSYPQLGGPRLNVYAFGSQIGGLAAPLENVPVNVSQYTGGIWGDGPSYRPDHAPSFGNQMYTIFGSRHYLDALYFAGNRANYQVPSGPGIAAGNGPANWDTVGGVSYFGLFWGCCERRGAFWAYRDKMLPAAFGGDNNPERQYFNDMIAENYWYEQAYLNHVGNAANYLNSIAPPLDFGYDEVQTFMDQYGFSTTYLAHTMLRDPLAEAWLPRWYKTYNALCSDTVAGHLSSFYCANYVYSPALKNTSVFSTTGAAFGDAFNGVDASDWGTDRLGTPPFTTISGGTLTAPLVGWFILTNGDLVKNVSCNGCFSTTNNGPDELVRNRWYSITNVDNNAGTFQIVNPATGQPFTGFTSGGAPFSGPIGIKYRPQYAPATGWLTPGYAMYAQSIIYGLNALGFNMNAAMNVINARGFIDPTNYQAPDYETRLNWDPSVVVP